MLLVDTKVDVQYKDGGVSNGKDSKGSIHKGASGGSGEDGNRGRFEHTGGWHEDYQFPNQP